MREDDDVRPQIGGRTAKRNNFDRIFGAEEPNLGIRLKNLREAEISPAIRLEK